MTELLAEAIYRKSESKMHEAMIIGQGLAGSAVAWTLQRSGMDVLVIDSGDLNSASRISAGLVTPYTGKRQAKDANFEQHREIAKGFYDDIGKELGVTLWLNESSVRWFQNTQEVNNYRQMREQGELVDTTAILDVRGKLAGYRMLSAARVLVSEYLTRTRERLQSEGRLITARLMIEDLQVFADHVAIDRLGRAARRVIFCQGYEGWENSWFPKIPDSAVRGEILEISLPTAETERVQHRTYWLAEQHQETDRPGRYHYLVGATYDRENLGNGATTEGLTELLEAARRLTDQPFEVIRHRAAIRAANKNRKYSVHRCLANPNVFIVNGMGSRGALLAPVAAGDLLKKLSEPFAQTAIVQRVNLTELAHKIVRRVIRAGDIVVDATAGNGHDTVFLGRLVGNQGTVIAIDLQQAAVASTTARVQEADISGRVSVYCENHANLGERMKSAVGKVAAVMFNLGYLPGSGKAIITRPESTREALMAAAQLLRPQGVITVIAYRGHEGGQAEAKEVTNTAEKYREEGFEVEVIESDPKNQESPMMTVIRRRK